jgi:hypothetical protein
LHKFPQIKGAQTCVCAPLTNEVRGLICGNLCNLWLKISFVASPKADNKLL